MIFYEVIFYFYWDVQHFLCWLGITFLNVVLWKYIPVWLVHYGVNTQATTIAEPELPGERKSTTQIPVMDKATEQRIDMEEVTWNFNVHATQLRFTRKPWSRRLRLMEPSGSNHQGPASNKMPWRDDICTNLLDRKELCTLVILGKDAFHNQLAFLLSNSVQWVDYIFKSLF